MALGIRKRQPTPQKSESAKATQMVKLAYPRCHILAHARTLRARVYFKNLLLNTLVHARKIVYGNVRALNFADSLQVV